MDAVKLDQAMERLDALSDRFHARFGDADEPRYQITVVKPGTKTDADFNEADHPRAADGKFGCGGGAAKTEKEIATEMAFHGAPLAPKMTPKQAVALSTSISIPLSKYGFKKVKGNSGLPDTDGLWFQGPNGISIMVHPAPPGAKYSSTFGANEAVYGSGGVALQKMLEKAFKEQGLPLPTTEPKAAPAQAAPAATEAPKATSAPTTGKGSSADVLIGHGYKPAGQVEHMGIVGHVFQAGDKKIVLRGNGSSAWYASSPGFSAKVGEGSDELKKFLQGGKGNWKSISPDSPAMGLLKNPQELAAEKKAQEAAQAAQSKIAAEHHAQQAQLTQAHQTFTSLAKGRPEPTPGEKAAVAAYSGSTYSSINTSLRHDPDAHQTAGTHVKQLTKYLANAELPHDATLYRGVAGDYAKILKSVLTVGGEFIDHGFSSMSTKAGSFGGSGPGHLNFEIKAPKGSKAASITGLGHHESEYEILGQRGSRFKVLAYDRKSGKVQVELLPPEYEE